MAPSKRWQRLRGGGALRPVGEAKADPEPEARDGRFGECGGGGGGGGGASGGASDGEA